MSKKDNFPSSGLVRLRQIISPDGPIPVGKSTWWKGCKTGLFPAPIKLGTGVTVWRAEEVRSLFDPAYANSGQCASNTNGHGGAATPNRGLSKEPRRQG